MSDDELISRAPRCRCYPVPLDVEVEWAVRWHEDGGIAWQGVGDKGRAEAINVARIYGYGTPESRVSVVRRTVTYGAWAG